MGPSRSSCQADDKTMIEAGACRALVEMEIYGASAGLAFGSARECWAPLREETLREK